jgi:hypothetical protein
LIIAIPIWWFVSVSSVRIVFSSVVFSSILRSHTSS